MGLAFKTSIAPFHQWTPDVYEGAPTPITSFMAVATKAAAFAVFIRFFDVALAPQASEWQPALAVLAAISIVVGNVGALGQTSLKRMMGYSGVAQAGYMLGGIVVASAAGINALVFYLAVYAFMNLAAFAVIIARERETAYGDEIRAVQGLGRDRPLLAWPLTIAMLGSAGLPATAGFIGKLYLIEALVEGHYTWLAVFIAVGTMISLAYYLRVVAAMWMRPEGEPPRAPAPRLRSPAPRPKPTRSTPRRAGGHTFWRRRCSPPRRSSSSASSPSPWSISPSMPAHRSRSSYPRPPCCITSRWRSSRPRSSQRSSSGACWGSPCCQHPRRWPMPRFGLNGREPRST